MENDKPEPISIKAIIRTLTVKSLFILIVLGLCIYNLIDFRKDMTANQATYSRLSLSFYGMRFSGLNEVLEDVEAVGYYTDKDTENNLHAAQFAQAQYILAPIILDKDHEKYTYVFLDCSSDEAAIAGLKKLKAKPIKRNQLGVILAKKEKDEE